MQKMKVKVKKFVEPKKGTDVGYGYKVGEGEMGKKEIPVKQQTKMAAAGGLGTKKVVKNK